MTRKNGSLGFALALALAGCGGSGSGGAAVAKATTIAPIISAADGDPELVALDVLPAAVALPSDGRGGFRPARLLVDGYFEDASVRDLTTAASLVVLDPDVARVTSAGRVEGLKAGTTTVEAAARDARGRLHVVRRQVRVGGATGGEPDRLELHPGPRALPLVSRAGGRAQAQRLVAVLVRTDGSREDVTDRVAVELLDPATRGSSPAAAVDSEAVVTARPDGEGAAVDVRVALVRGHLAAAARLALGPTTAPIASTTDAWRGEPLASSSNPLDQAALAALRRAGVEPAPLCDDVEFLRRVTADLVGRPPLAAEVGPFLADPAPDKRARLVRRLLALPEHHAHWARAVIAPWLAPWWAPLFDPDMPQFDRDLEGLLAAGKPLGDVLTEVAVGGRTGLRAKFDAWHEGEGGRNRPAQLLEAFGGVTVRCAMCHEHKLTGGWPQARGQGLFSFFAAETGSAELIGQSQVVQPAWDLDGTPVGNLPAFDPNDPTGNLQARRAKFAELFAASRTFQRGTAHRIWSALATPLLDPVRVLETPRSTLVQPAVLDALEAEFRARGGALGPFLELVCTSRLYQLTSDGMTTRFDRLLARRTVERHLGEVLQRGAHGMVGAPGPFTRDAFAEDQLGVRTGRATNVGDALTLMNAPAPLRDRLLLPGTELEALAADLAAQRTTLPDAVRTLFRRALSRDPSGRELAEATAAVAGAPPREALEDVLAGLAASAEAALRY